jgi:anti-sigma factor RsiW
MPQHPEFHDCDGVLNRLDAWIDGDLDRAEAIGIEAHLERCPACQAERRLAEQMLTELRAMPDFGVPERVLQAVERKTRPRWVETIRSSLPSEVRRRLPAAAAFAAVVLAVVLVAPWDWRRGPEYSDEEIQRAAAETRLALAYIGSITRRAERRVKEKVLEEGAAAKAVRDVNRTFQIIGGMGAGAATPPATPYPTVKGS